MLENWSVTNFKSILETKVFKGDGTETNLLAFKPLTVFCGANSSGKSSLLQSILLIAQTMRSRDKEFPIVLNGDYISLGMFEDVKTINSKREEIGICFTYKSESRSLIYKDEYPFTHIQPDIDKVRAKETFEEWKEILQNGAKDEVEDDINESYRNEKKQSETDSFYVDAASFELFFLSSEWNEKTKILPALTRAVFSFRFYQQENKDNEKHSSDETNGNYILKWNILKSKDKEGYEVKKVIELPDGTSADIMGEKEFLPFKADDSEMRFQEKLPKHYNLKIYETYCVLNHFFPDEMNHIMNSGYFDSLFILFSLGCYDVNNILKIFGNKEYIRWLKFLSKMNALKEYTPDMIKFLKKPYNFNLYTEIIIPKSVHDYIRDYILQGIEGVEDLLESFEYTTDDIPEENTNNIIGLEENELLDIVVEHYYEDGEEYDNRIVQPVYWFDITAWESKLDKLDDHKKEVIFSRLYTDSNRTAIFARYMFWRWEVWMTSVSAEGEIKYDYESEFIKKHLVDIFDRFSKSIYYLGPLREDPKSLYPYPDNNDSFYLGKKGEHTASVLFLHGDKKNTFPLPNWEEDEKSNVRTIDAIKQWLAHIGVADDIKTELDSGIALKIKTPGSSKWNDLTNVGVGVSQVIPIVVMCLTAQRGTTLIFEQPELHLHPKMQTRLAEFFMAIAGSGIQCIIETHSEHFINAMRLNIASDDLGKEKMLDKSIIYFVEKIQNVSMFREIEINDLGIIPHWPKDFFDEGINQTDKIILASSKKRTQKFHKDEEIDDE
jgi:predicted ATPase